MILVAVVPLLGGMKALWKSAAWCPRTLLHPSEPAFRTRLVGEAKYVAELLVMGFVPCANGMNPSPSPPSTELSSRRDVMAEAKARARAIRRSFVAASVDQRRQLLLQAAPTADPSSSSWAPAPAISPSSSREMSPPEVSPLDPASSELSPPEPSLPVRELAMPAPASPPPQPLPTHPCPAPAPSRMGSSGHAPLSQPSSLRRFAPPEERAKAAAAAAAAAKASGGAPQCDPRVLNALRAALLRDMERVVDLFHRLDADSDGSVTKSEFRRALPMLLQRMMRQEEIAGPDVSSRTRSGGAKGGAKGGARCSGVDSGVGCTGTTPKWTGREMDALFNELDGDGSGSISYRELNRALRQGLSVSCCREAATQGSKRPRTHERSLEECPPTAAATRPKAVPRIPTAGGRYPRSEAERRERYRLAQIWSIPDLEHRTAEWERHLVTARHSGVSPRRLSAMHAEWLRQEQQQQQSRGASGSVLSKPSLAVRSADLR
jgi:hypothetical protein